MVSRLTKQSPVFGLALIAVLAVAAMSAASASALSFSSSKGYPVSFTGSAGWHELRIEKYGTLTCTAATSNGKITGATGGELAMTLTGCQSIVSGTCNSSGQPSGTIVTSQLGLKPVYINAAHTEYGLALTTPESGVFAEFSCGIDKHVWQGPGLVGKTSLPLETWRTSIPLNFAATGGEQAYATSEGGNYQLHEPYGGPWGRVGFVTAHTLTTPVAVKLVP